MSSPQVPRETLKFLIYHELLHANGYWYHDVLFRGAEWLYPNTDEHDNFLDSLKHRFKIIDNDLPMYDIEPEVVKPVVIKHKSENNDDNKQNISSSKRRIVFTRQCTYQIADEDESDSDKVFFSAPIPENPDDCFMLFAYCDGRFAKVTLNSFNLNSRRSYYKNAYSNHASLVWMGLFENDDDIVVYSSINKIVVFNSKIINPVKSTNSKGVMVQIPKNNSKVIKVELLDETNLINVDYYRCNKIPVVGLYLKNNDCIINGLN